MDNPDNLELLRQQASTESLAASMKRIEFAYETLDEFLVPLFTRQLSEILVRDGHTPQFTVNGLLSGLIKTQGADGISIVDSGISQEYIDQATIELKFAASEII